MIMMSKAKHKIPLIAVAVILLAFGMVISARRAPRPMLETPSIENYEPLRATLEGTLVCLLPADQESMQTDECALGLRTDDGTHYAIDFMLMSSIPESHEAGDRITGSGVLVPIERLSTDHWRKYGVVGIFSVTDGFKVLK